MTEFSSLFLARPGGVWTEEAGTITGELELRTVCADNGSVSAGVRHADGQCWYTVTGSTGIRLHDRRDHNAVHALLVNVLRHPRR